MTGKHSSVKYSGAMSFRQHRLHDDSDAKLNAVGQSCQANAAVVSHGMVQATVILAGVRDNACRL